MERHGHRPASVLCLSPRGWAAAMRTAIVWLQASIPWIPLPGGEGRGRKWQEKTALTPPNAPRRLRASASEGRAMQNRSAGPHQGDACTAHRGETCVHSPKQRRRVRLTPGSLPQELTLPQQAQDHVPGSSAGMR